MSRFKSALAGWATPLTAGLFLVSTVSGVALYFHWNSGLFHEMHEVLSLVLLVPVVLHLWKNWLPIKIYFRHAVMPVALALSLAAGGWYAYDAAGQPSGRGGNPAFAVLGLIQNAPLATLAPVLSLTPDEAVRKLEAAGIPGATGDTTVTALAAGSGHDAMEIMAALTAR
jgi:hypothetical protein